MEARSWTRFQMHTPPTRAGGSQRPDDVRPERPDVVVIRFAVGPVALNASGYVGADRRVGQPELPLVPVPVLPVVVEVVLVPLFPVFPEGPDSSCHAAMHPS